ncbi:unnamed protein product [Ectocarpus sp. CCAP 1310/34]|nr:unnamed protein product [Ectocarpus sp. CCAP 1310/34]
MCMQTAAGVLFCPCTLGERVIGALAKSVAERPEERSLHFFGVVCRLATGKSTRLPLLSPSALWQYERSKSTTAAAISATAYPALAAASSSSSALPVANGAGFWLAVVTPSRAILARQRLRLRRLKRRIAAAGGAENGYRTTPLGAGGARVWWVLPPPLPPPPAASKSRRHGSRAGGPGESMATPTGGGKHLRGRGDVWRLATGGDTAAVSPVEGEASPAAAAAAARGGVVGHVWVSLKLRDPSMLMMRVVRQWNMARDEASVQQRRAAQLEAKRLWMFMPGISLWRVLLQLAGMSLLVSYCVTLTLRAFHSTRCRAAFNCDPETDPKLASLREWQTLADNMLSALSFLDMVLQFRTGYVDKSSKIIINPKKVGLHYLRTWFIPDLWCSLPYGTMQPLLQPLLDEVEGAADSLSSASADHTAGVAAKSDNMIKATDSPLSMWVFKLSQRLHIGKINGIRGTRAFKYLDDSAMGVDLAVKQVVHVVRGRRRVLKWLGNPPKERGRIGKFFFRVGLTNKWTRIVLSYRLLGYAKVIGTLVRAMRVLAVAVRAVPRATRVLRLAAVFIRSYEGRRRSKDLHEASIVIQRRAGRHMALKVAGQLKTNLRRRTRARSESDIRISSTAAAPTGGGGGGGVGSPAFAFPKDNDDDDTRSRVVSDAGRSSIGDAYGRDADPSSRDDGGGGRRRMMMPSPLRRSPARRRRGLSTPPRSPSLASDGGGSGSVGGWSSGVGMPSYSSTYRTPASVASSSEHYGEYRPRSPSLIPSEVWSEDLSWDELNFPRSPQRGAGAANSGWATEWDGHSAGTPTTPPRTGTGVTR